MSPAKLYEFTLHRPQQALLPAGLLQQAQQQLDVAKAPCNVLRWRSPAVVFHFPQGAHPAVKAELNVSTCTASALAYLSAAVCITFATE